MAYELDFPSSCVHNFFYVSCLKKVLGHTMTLQKELPNLDEEWKLILELEFIFYRHYLSFHIRTIMEYLIKWKNMPPKEAT